MAAGYCTKSNPILLLLYRRIGRWNLQHHSLSSVHESYLGKKEIMEGTAYNSYFLVPRMAGVRVTGEEAVDFDKGGYTC